MQCWRLERGGQTIFGFADLVPMRAHVPFPWIMGYDLYPVETLEAKKALVAASCSRRLALFLLSRSGRAALCSWSGQERRSFVASSLLSRVGSQRTVYDEMTSHSANRNHRRQRALPDAGADGRRGGQSRHSFWPSVRCVHRRHS